MKRNSLFIIAMLALLCLSSCKKEKQQTVEDDDLMNPQMELTQADTAEVLSLAQRYIELRKEGRTEDAMAMIYYLNGDSIIPLPKSLRARFDRYYSRIDLRGKEALIDWVQFYTEKDCRVKYTVTLFEQKPGENLPNKMSFALNPIRRDGKWYLTLADDASDQRPEGSKIQN